MTKRMVSHPSGRITKRMVSHPSGGMTKRMVSHPSGGMSKRMVSHPSGRMTKRMVSHPSRTDRQTDRQTDRAGCRVACTRLKNTEISSFHHLSSNYYFGKHKEGGVNWRKGDEWRKYGNTKIPLLRQKRNRRRILNTILHLRRNDDVWPLKPQNRKKKEAIKMS